MKPHNNVSKAFNVWDEIDRLETVNKALVEACKNVLLWYDSHPEIVHQAFYETRKALALAEGM